MLHYKAAMLLEIEIRSANARNDVYELRNYLMKAEGIQLRIKEQAPQQGEMTLGLIEPIIIGAVEGIVGHSIGEMYTKLLKPRIDGWLKEKKGTAQLEVLSTVKDDATRIHFLEDNKGRSEVFENLKYAIDVDHTRAVLIGNSEFDGNFSAIPPVKGNIEDLFHLLTDKLHIGLPPENIVVVFNKTNTEIEEALLQQSRQPNTETLLIYFAGHGHRTDVKKLFLVAKNSRKIDDYLLGGIDFDFISNVILRNATAKQKILILDACHSGIATQGTDDMMAKMDVKGSYVLASSPGDEVSYFDKNGRNTYFTGVLLDALNKGINNAQEMIALDDLYDYSKDQLSEKNFPHPIYKSELNIPPSNFFIARNPSFSIEKLKQRPAQLFKQGRFEEALYEYRLLVQRYPEDIELRKMATECETNALFNRLVQDGDELFFHVHDYAAAAGKYRKALQIKEDMLVLGKLNRCEDYLRTGSKEEKKEVELKKMEAVIEKEKKKETTTVIQKIKTEPQKDEKKKEDKAENEQQDILLLFLDKYKGTIMASIWLFVAVFFIFRSMDTRPFDAFKTIALPVGLAGLALITARRKKISTTELALYAHGMFICLFPLIAGYVDSREHGGSAIFLFLIFNACFAAFLYLRLKQFTLAGIIIASVQILYLSFLFFYMLFYQSFRPQYGDNTTASIIGMIIGLLIGIGVIIWMRRKWIELRKKFI